MTVKYLKYFPKPLLDDLVEGRWLPVVGGGMSKNAALPPGKSLPLWNELGKLVAEDISDYSYFNALDALSAYEHEFGRPRLISLWISLWGRTTLSGSRFGVGPR